MKEQPQVTALYICPTKGQKDNDVTLMQEKPSVHAIKGVGLEGDRYALGIGAYSHSRINVIRHVTLVDEAALAAANAEHATHFTAADTRRNIVTRGIDLNALVNQEFLVGNVRMRGVELCTPCARPSALSGKPGFEEAFQDRGGLRAEILNDGDIRVKDRIRRIRRRRHADDSFETEVKLLAHSLGLGTSKEQLTWLKENVIARGGRDGLTGIKRVLELMQQKNQQDSPTTPTN